MAREYVPIFFDWLDVTQDLTAEEKGNLIDAVVAYASGGEYEHLLTGSVRIAFRFMKGQIDRNSAISDVRSKARSKTNEIKTEQNGTNENKTEETESNSPKEKEKEKEKENKKREREQKQMAFARFWTAYPRKVSKETARKAFERIDPDEDLLNAMIEAIEKQKLSPQWQEDGGQYIPHPATWLNGKRWEDEPQTIRAVTRAVNGYKQRDNSNAADEALERMRQMIRDSEAGRLA